MDLRSLSVIFLQNIQQALMLHPFISPPHALRPWGGDKEGFWRQVERLRRLARLPTPHEGPTSDAS